MVLFFSLRQIWPGMQSEGSPHSRAPKRCMRRGSILATTRGRIRLLFRCGWCSIHRGVLVLVSERRANLPGGVITKYMETTWVNGMLDFNQDVPQHLRMLIELTSIHSKLKAIRPKSVAILCQRLQAYTDWEDQKKVTRYKVADDVGLLETLLLKEGIRTLSIPARQIEESKAEILACDMCVISGDPYYQLFRLGREMIDLGFTSPIFLQILKEDAGKSSNARAAVTQATNHNVLQLLGSLVYLTKTRPEPKEILFDLPEPPIELPQTSPSFQEGRIRTAISNIYERSAGARKACIEVHGCKCAACGFDFERTYGADAKGLIHVHHLSQLGGTTSIRHVNPEDDLRPVCPNCHMFIHSRMPMLSIDDVIEALARASS
jgi:hypothetical protein